jgi:predicted amidohydrolase YtcJ
MRIEPRLTATLGALLAISCLWAQVQAPPVPWRGAGATPCVGSDGGIYQCPPAPRVVAIRAGRLFNSTTGQILTAQVVLVSGERIAEVGPEAQIKIPAGTQVIDLRSATLLPGLIDAHTHMFNTRGPKGTTETSMLIAVQNVQADLRADSPRHGI